MKKIKIFLISLAIQLIGIIGNIISRIVFGNFLSETEFGIYNIVILMPNLIALLINVGMGHAISIITAKNKVISDNLVKIIYLYSIIIGTIASLLGILIFQRIYNDIDLVFIMLGCFLTTIYLLNYLLSFLFLGLQKSSIYFLSTNLVHVLSPVIFLVIVTTIDLSLFNAIIAYSLSLLLVTVLLNWNLYKEFKYKINSKKNILDDFKQLNQLGLPMYFTSLFNFLNYRIDTFIIGAMLPFSLLSNYTIAVLFIDSVGKINQIINILIFQKIPTMEKGKSKEKLMGQGLVLSFIICLFTSLALLLIGNKLISFVFPGKFDLAYEVMLYLIPGMFFISFFRIIYHRLAADGYGKYSSIGSFISVILTIIFNLVLIPIYGINGSAIASSLAYFLMCTYIIWVYIKLRKELN